MVNKNKGFTLIELLVVIAIIGILSSIVLASLNTARSKGADAAIKGNLNGIRAQAELYYDTNGNYGTQAYATTCSGAVGTGVFADPNVRQAVAGALNSSPAAGAACVAGTTITNGGPGWALAVPLKTNASNYFCIDSTGNSTTTSVGSAGLSTTDAVCG